MLAIALRISVLRSEQPSEMGMDQPFHRAVWVAGLVRECMVFQVIGRAARPPGGAYCRPTRTPSVAPVLSSRADAVRPNVAACGPGLQVPCRCYRRAESGFRARSSSIVTPRESGADGVSARPCRCERVHCRCWFVSLAGLFGQAAIRGAPCAISCSQSLNRADGTGQARSGSQR
jgi:hypothetical protein